MTAVGARPARGVPARAVGAASPRVLLALWVGAAVISGFTFGRELDPFDGGLLLQAASRIAGGQWPYADFGWPYGPGHPLLMALSFEAAGPNDVAWRVLRVLTDATAAVLVWRLVRPVAGPRWALAAWAASAAILCQPATANPAPVALTLALAALAAAAATSPRALLAGALVALTAFWRPDFGVAAGAAVAAALLTGGARRSAVVAAGTALGATALLYLPFAVAAGPGHLLDALVGDSAGQGAWWRLPFPIVYGGPLPAWPPRALAEHAKDALGYELPLVGVVAVAASLARLAAGRARPQPVAAGLLVLSLGALAYLLSRADELHAQPLLVCVCALGPVAAAGVRRRRGGAARRALAGVLAVTTGIVLAGGAADRLSALLLPPRLESLRLPGEAGVRVPPDEARALPPLVALVQRLAPPGTPIFVAPRRSDLVTLTDPMIHVLARRPNLLDRDALLLAEPAEQARVVAVLRARRPVVVRWTDPRSSAPEPNRRGRPSPSRALDDHLAAAYVLRARFGRYDVLVPRRLAGR